MNENATHKQCKDHINPLVLFCNAIKYRHYYEFLSSSISERETSRMVLLVRTPIQSINQEKNVSSEPGMVHFSLIFVVDHESS